MLVSLLAAGLWLHHAILQQIFKLNPRTHFMNPFNTVLHDKMFVIERSLQPELIPSIHNCLCQQMLSSREGHSKETPCPHTLLPHNVSWFLFNCQQTIRLQEHGIAVNELDTKGKSQHSPQHSLGIHTNTVWSPISYAALSTMYVCDQVSCAGCTKHCECSTSTYLMISLRFTAVPYGIAVHGIMLSHIVIKAHCYALQCTRIDCEEIRGWISRQLVAGHFNHEGLRQLHTI